MFSWTDLWRAAGAAAPERGLLSAAVTPHREPELLRHLGAETLPVIHRVLATVPTKLQNGDLRIVCHHITDMTSLGLTMMARARPHSSTTNTPPMF